MALFQNSVLKKHQSNQDQALLLTAYQAYQSYFFNPTIQENIRNAKEEQFQEGFLRDNLHHDLSNDLTMPSRALSFEAEWMAYFNEQKQKALALKAEIDRIDQEIDALVYELYGFTEEEIKTVEGGGKMI